MCFFMNNVPNKCVIKTDVGKKRLIGFCKILAVTKKNIYIFKNVKLCTFPFKLIINFQCWGKLWYYYAKRKFTNGVT